MRLLSLIFFKVPVSSVPCACAPAAASAAAATSPVRASRIVLITFIETLLLGGTASVSKISRGSGEATALAQVGDQSAGIEHVAHERRQWLTAHFGFRPGAQDEVAGRIERQLQGVALGDPRGVGHYRQ